jgi:hypothetical protein
LGTREPISIRKEVLVEMVGSEGTTSKRSSYWWYRLGARELISIRKEVLAEMVGNDEANFF